MRGPRHHTRQLAGAARRPADRGRWPGHAPVAGGGRPGPRIESRRRAAQVSAASSARTAATSVEDLQKCRRANPRRRPAISRKHVRIILRSRAHRIAPADFPNGSRRSLHRKHVHRMPTSRRSPNWRVRDSGAAVPQDSPLSVAARPATRARNPRNAASADTRRSPRDHRAAEHHRAVDEGVVEAKIPADAFRVQRAQQSEGNAPRVADLPRFGADAARSPDARADSRPVFPTASGWLRSS